MILVIDTATRWPTLALAASDGSVIAQRQWESRHRHGEQLLEELDSLLAETGTDRRDFSGVICGTGPGSFTGLRIGLATAKVIAYSLGIPIVGISTTAGLAIAAAPAGGSTEVAVTLPAGAADRYVHRLRITGGRAQELEPPRLVAGEAGFAEAVGDADVVAIELTADQVSAPAVELGELARSGLAQALAREGARRIAGGTTDDAATLVPAYVALPRGIAAAAAEMAWSPDLR